MDGLGNTFALGYDHRIELGLPVLGRLFGTSQRSFMVSAIILIEKVFIGTFKLDFFTYSLDGKKEIYKFVRHHKRRCL